MAQWRKTLARMLADTKPVGFTYDEAAAVLSHLGFELAPSAGGSHRLWRGLSPEGNPVMVGLVDRGSGAMKPYLVRHMVSQLRANGLVPADLDR
ncbi:MAG: hypothetical protein ABIQ41_02735 [Gemmatimonadales bacterium]